MNYGYIRVSTDKQSVENQRFEIEEYFKARSLHVDGWIEETVSGTKYYNNRRLGKLLKTVKKGDLIVCTEISRLGRSLFMIMEILNVCMLKECAVCTIKENYSLGTDTSSKVLAFAFGISAEIERTLISQRTREALALRRAEGKTLGRPKGTRNKCRKMDGKEERMRFWMEKGLSLSAVARKIRVSRSTLFRYLREKESSGLVK